MSAHSGRSRRLQLGIWVAAVAVAAAGLGACGSSSPVSSPTTVAAPPTTGATTTLAPPTTGAPPTTVPTSTSLPAARQGAFGRRYRAIVGPANTANGRFAATLEAYLNRRASLAKLTRAVSVYSAASARLRSSLRAVKWPPAVEAAVTRLVADDKRLITRIRALETVPPAQLTKPVKSVLATFEQIKLLSTQIRKDLGLPPDD